MCKQLWSTWSVSVDYVQSSWSYLGVVYLSQTGVHWFAWDWPKLNREFWRTNTQGVKTSLGSRPVCVKDKRTTISRPLRDLNAYWLYIGFQSKSSFSSTLSLIKCPWAEQRHVRSMSRNHNHTLSVSFTHATTTTIGTLLNKLRPDICLRYQPDSKWCCNFSCRIWM